MQTARRGALVSLLATLVASSACQSGDSTGADVSIYGFAIHQTTGALTPVPNSPIRNVAVPYSIAVDPSGRFVLVGQDVAEPKIDCDAAIARSAPS